MDLHHAPLHIFDTMKTRQARTLGLPKRPRHRKVFADKTLKQYGNLARNALWCCALKKRKGIDQGMGCCVLLVRNPRALLFQ